MAVSVIVPSSAGCDYTLVSNAAPALACAYAENGDVNSGTHSTSRANAQSIVSQLVAGRQMPVMFRPLIEGNSDVFERTLIVAMSATPNPDNTKVDRQPFDRLVTLIETPSPALVLLDAHGRSWYVGVEIVTLDYAWHGQEHNTDLKFTEVSAVPLPLTVATPPVP